MWKLRDAIPGSGALFGKTSRRLPDLVRLLLAGSRSRSSVGKAKGRLRREVAFLSTVAGVADPGARRDRSGTHELRNRLPV